MEGDEQEVRMKKKQKPQLVRLGRVTSETRAVQMVGKPELGNPLLSYAGG
jgi:hypothetical protein